MKDDKRAPDADDEGVLDRFDDAVVAADDERMITLAEIAEAESNDRPKR